MKKTGKIHIQISAILLIGVSLFGWGAHPPIAQSQVAPSQKPTIKIPKLSPAAAKGQKVFNATCAECHGINATGSDKGPPLIHDIYNPGHHGDYAFYRAAKTGTPQHHWRFGNMPPQTNVTDDQIASILRFIRETQEANGIFYRKHKM
ncbi:MAG: cytochrome C [Robiginitomaculum sp.]|nr:MAG: cytochrome C [Robiginitomaculum sp.]